MCNCFLSCIPALRHRAAPRPPQDSNFNPSKKSRAPSGLGTSNGSQTPSDLETLETQETQTEEGKADPICWRDEIWDKHIRRYRLVRPFQSKKSKLNKFAGRVLLVRQVFNTRGDPTVVEIDVIGVELQEALREIWRCASSVDLTHDPPIISPQLMFHSAHWLEQASETAEEKRKEEISTALHYIDMTFEAMGQKLVKMLPEGEITWPDIWAIMPPNELVFAADELGEPQVYKIRTCKQEQTRDGQLIYEVKCESLAFDGKKLGHVKNYLCIEHFEGTAKINQLPVYPVDFHPDWEEIQDFLLQRAEKTLSLHETTPILREYSGLALREKEIDSSRDLPPQRQKFKAHGRIVIDPVNFDSIKAENELIPRLRDSVSPENLITEERLTLSSLVYGFNFGEKSWGAFAVSRVAEIAWNDAIYSALVMPDFQKDLIKQLVEAHGQEKGDYDDFVREKGKGLVGLLMGPPGLGKTMTAEAIAEVARKPLYTMSSGELGESVYDVSNNLARVMELATTWHTVLLIDEADVFLAQRSSIHVERNAITSTFLRQLEYYPGILILTTNRASSIDSAFESRIHFCHQYEDLSSEARKSIWKSFLDKTEQDDSVRAAYTMEELESLASLDFNGRQIKNTWRIAVTLASAQSKTLTVDDLLKVSKALPKFYTSNDTQQLADLPDLKLSRKATDHLQS